VKQLLFLAVIGMSPLLLRAHSSAAAPQDQNTKQDAKNTAKDVGGRMWGRIKKCRQINKQAAKKTTDATSKASRQNCPDRQQQCDGR
jgi:hypothetical protein